jgi:hypothetical protein
VVEQFIAANVKTIQARRGEWIDPANNADAFFVVLG